MQFPYPLSWETLRESFLLSPFYSLYYPAVSYDFLDIGVFDKEIKALLFSTSLNSNTAWANATPTFFNFLEVS